MLVQEPLVVEKLERTEKAYKALTVCAAFVRFMLADYRQDMASA